MTKKKKISIAVVVIILACIIAYGMDTDKTADASANGTNAINITLTAGEQGEYGDIVTLNAGTEGENTYYAYHVPAGTYSVQNVSEYPTQVNVYSDETQVTEEGWEEPAEGEAFLLQVDESAEITVEDGQYIKINEPTVIVLTSSTDK